MNQDRFKFRGKDFTTDKWIYSTGISKGTIKRKRDWIFLWDEDREIWSRIKPETLGQCTGLKDKHCKLIFEGDTIKHVREIEIITSGHPALSNAESDLIGITRIGKASITPSKGVVFTGRKIVKDLLEFEECIIQDSKWRGVLTCVSDYAEIISTIHDKESTL